MTDQFESEDQKDRVPRTKRYRTLHDQVVARPGAAERLAALREDTLAEIGLFELRRALELSQTNVGDELGVSQSAVSQLENASDVKVSTLREYLARLGARLRLVAVFDDDDEVVLRIGDEPGPPTGG